MDTETMIVIIPAPSNGASIYDVGVNALTAQLRRSHGPREEVCKWVEASGRLVGTYPLHKVYGEALRYARTNNIGYGITDLTRT